MSVGNAVGPAGPPHRAWVATPRWLALGLMAWVIWGCASCSRQPASVSVSGDIVAVVGDQVIGRAAFEEYLTRRGQTARTPEQLAAVLDELVRVEAACAKARAAGFDTNPAVQAALKRVIAAQYQAAQLPDTGSAPRVTERELDDYYQAHRSEFTVPEKVRAAIVFFKVPTKATAEKQAEHAAAAAAVLAEARHLPAGSVGFGALALKYSEDTATRYQGGDVGWLSKQPADFRFGPEVAEAIFTLTNAGDLTPVIRTRDGLVLARLMEKKPASTPPLSELKERLTYRLSRAKAAQRETDFQASLKAGLNIQINGPLLNSLARPADEPRPPGLPGGATAQVSPPR